MSNFLDNKPNLNYEILKPLAKKVELPKIFSPPRTAKASFLNINKSIEVKNLKDNNNFENFRSSIKSALIKNKEFDERKGIIEG